ncbi:CinA family protein [Sulfurospirillum barnesii]|uniref:Competence/damage-inducible protein CinA-like protein n=1 Tax=Sulfurospirillum barnesii (strain ATCC 700032 / DSM 10660 / SES-3) TaxID=760154 RepID=I3XV72_SULBS|nr:CinA family protein [Sulfurospirillum barnesii]AFL67846.1 competence/damage-inducible protein CinA-like protein [Sulfurospirillum barnesii SES-3]
MKSSLIVVGKALRYNTSFLNYIHTTVSNHLDFPDQTVYIDKNDKELFSIVEEAIAHSEDTLILTTAESFNLINKVVATLGEEALELKEGMLIPSKTVHIEENSYLLVRENKRINVLKICETLKLPRILINNKSSALFSVINIDEDSLKIFLEPLAQNYEIKITPTLLIDGWIIVEAISSKYGNIENFFKAATSLLPQKIINHPDVIEHIIQRLQEQNKTLSIAESCTGGLITTMFTQHAGVSAVFKGGLVTYANEIKESWLGVSGETLEHFGAVSELCVREMLEGVLNASLADYAIATSGIAGPTGGSLEKPVGTVYVGARDKEGNVMIERLLLEGNRAYIQTQSAYHALKLLLHVGESIFLKSEKNS